MSTQIANSLHAYGSVSSAGAKVSGQGFAPAKSATGQYNLNLDEDIDAAESTIIVTLRGGTSGSYRVVHTDDGTKQVLTFAPDGTTASDRDFDFLVLRSPVNPA